jgi:hypothetical protein
VPPLDVSDLLAVQFLGFSIANFSVPDARLSVSWRHHIILIAACIAGVIVQNARALHTQPPAALPSWQHAAS